MRLTDTVLKRVRSEVPQSEFVPFTHLNSPTIFESRNGQIGTVIQLEGAAFDTALPSDLNRWKRTLHHAFAQLDERFCLIQTMHRRQQAHALSGNFPNRFAEELDAAYHAQFKAGSMYVNDLYLTVIYKGITSGKIGKGLSLINHLKNKAIKEARAVSRASQIKILSQKVRELCALLGAFKPHVLGSDVNPEKPSELLQFLSLWTNAGVPQRLPAGATFHPTGGTYAEAKKQHLQYPHGHLAPYLSRCRLFFGTAIQFNDEATNTRCYGGVLSIKQYSKKTSSTMLDNLLQLDGEFIATHSFAMEEKSQSLKLIKSQAIKLANAGDAATKQQEAFEEAKEEVAGNETVLGYHHHTLMLLAPELPELEARINQAVKCYGDAGMTAVRETIGLIPAFWSQLPTNQQYIARSSLITLENFVDFAPLHNYLSGYCDGNHLGSAVTLLETPSKTPVFFNYHVRGRKGNPSKGHALIIGGNDSGKTALMTFMDAQMQRYGGSTFYFDRDQGAKIYILASGGHYSVLSPNFPETASFNPFQLPDTPENRSFCHTLLMLLCKNRDDEILLAETAEQLKHCVDYAFDVLLLEHRRLSTVVQLLPLDFPHWAALRRWLKAQGQFSDGEHAYLFDNATDALELHTMMGFDMTHFLDNEPSHVRTPLMFYLLHRVRQSLDGRRVSLLLDEGWQYFIDAFWVKWLEKLLPTLRKYNAHLVIATQSPSSVLKSPIAPMMLDNMPTHIFFANPQARRSDYIEGFHLTEAEYQIVLNTPPAKRQFLYKQEQQSVLCQLNLGHLPNYLSVLSGNKQTVQQVDNLRQLHGTETAAWLPEFYRAQQGAA